MAKRRLSAVKGYFLVFVLLALLLSGGMAGICSDGYQLTLALDKQEYHQGDQLTVKAKVYGDQVSDIYIGMTLTLQQDESNNNDQVVAVWQERTDADGEGVWDVESGTLEPGTYIIDAAADGVTAIPVQFNILLSPPSIESTNPADGSEDVAVSKTITVVFNKDVEPGSAYEEITLKDEDGESVEIKSELEGDTLIINPENDLDKETEYTLYIPVEAISGLQEEFKLTFTTAAGRSSGGGSGGGGGTISLPGTIPGGNSGCSFTDLPDSHWAAGVIKELCLDGIIKGYPGGIFKPDNKVTRAEFAKMIVMSKGLSEVRPAQATFKDVKAGDWYYGYVEAAVQAGLVEGLDTGEFQPNRNITREQIAAILVRALGKGNQAAGRSGQQMAFQDERSISGWAANYVAAAVNEGLVNGYPDRTFKPVSDTTRAEACTMLSRLLEKI